jgi:hypothetical protein
LNRTFLLLDRFSCYSIDFLFLITRLLTPIKWRHYHILIEPSPDPLLFRNSRISDNRTLSSRDGRIFLSWNTDGEMSSVAICLLSTWTSEPHTSDISWTLNQTSRQTLCVFWSIHSSWWPVCSHPSSDVFQSHPQWTITRAHARFFSATEDLAQWGETPLVLLTVECRRFLSVVYRHSLSSQQWSQLDPQPSCSQALIFFEEGLPLPWSHVLLGSRLSLGGRVTFSHQETSVSLTFNTPHTRAAGQFWLHIEGSRKTNNCALLCNCLVVLPYQDQTVDGLEKNCLPPTKHLMPWGGGGGVCDR